MDGPYRSLHLYGMFLFVRVRHFFHGKQAKHPSSLSLFLRSIFRTQTSKDPKEDHADRLQYGVTFLLTDIALLKLVYGQIPNIVYWTVVV